MPTSRHDRQLYWLIGQRVRERRRGHLTQEQLADLVGVARTSITNLEMGRQRAPIHQLVRVAEALGCELRELVPSMAEIGLHGPDESRTLDEVPVVGDLTPAARSVLSRYVETESKDGS